MVSFTSLAEDILASAKRLDEHLASKGLPPSSFDNDTLADLPNDVEATRNSLIDTTHALKQLAQGPHGSTMEILFSWTGTLSLRAIYAYKIADAVPLTGSTTYAAISSQTCLPGSLVRRFLRPAIASHIFQSPTPDTIAHTASSRLFVTDPDFRDAVGLQTTELGPAATSVIDTISKNGDSDEPGNTAFALQHGKPIFEVLGQDPERARRFGASMRYHAKGEGYAIRHLAEGYDWAAFDRPGATVVDVGGGHGAVSQVLAKSTKEIKFVVQDLPGTVAQARKDLPEELEGRVEFVAHDFFTEQPVKEADVYLMRWILHNWSDKYCVKILKALVPALTKQSQRIILYEYVLPELPDTRLSERMGANLDMIMLSIFNGAERTKADFERVLQAADARFRIEKVVKPQGSAMSIIAISLSLSRMPSEVVS